MTIDDACDYIIVKVGEAGVPPNRLKLQKLLYYAQAWHLAFYGPRIFNEKFQAWIHGPVCRPVYNRFALGDGKSLYSTICEDDILPTFDMGRPSRDERAHIDGILEVYAGLTGTQLEDMTHHEDPWLIARRGYRPSQRCEVEIDEDDMRQYYGARIVDEG